MFFLCAFSFTAKDLSAKVQSQQAKFNQVVEDRFELTWFSRYEWLHGINVASHS